MTDSLLYCYSCSFTKAVTLKGVHYKDFYSQAVKTAVMHTFILYFYIKKQVAFCTCYCVYDKVCFTVFISSYFRDRRCSVGVVLFLLTQLSRDYEQMLEGQGRTRLKYVMNLQQVQPLPNLTRPQFTSNRDLVPRSQTHLPYWSQK